MITLELPAWSMRLLMIASCTLVSCLCLGQETRFVVKKGVTYVEEYNVQTADKNVRHGTYVKYRHLPGNAVVIESGSYTNGEKSGLWEVFFNEITGRTRNSIKERGYYANGKKNGIWTYYYLDTIANVTSVEKVSRGKKIESINVSIEQRNSKLRMAGAFLNDKRVGEWITWDEEGELLQKCNLSTGRLIFDRSVSDTLQWNADRKPVFLGGPASLEYHLITNMKRMIPARINRDTTKTIVTFKIDQNGRTRDVVVTENSGGKAVANELIRLISTTDTYWIPGFRNGAKSVYTMEIQYYTIMMQSTPTSKTWKSFFAVKE